jgi:hypothetical protein
MEQPFKTKTVFPVTLAEAKRHLRVDENWRKDDEYITTLIEAATETAEEYAGFDIADTLNTVKLWGFSNNMIILDEGNKVRSAQYYTVDPSILSNVDHIEKNWNSSVVHLTDFITADPLTLSYTTGYEDSIAPAKLKQAILIIIGNYYDMERTGFSNLQNQKAWERILDSVKINIM